MKDNLLEILVGFIVILLTVLLLFFASLILCFMIRRCGSEFNYDFTTGYAIKSIIDHDSEPTEIRDLVPATDEIFWNEAHGQNLRQPLI